MSVPHMLFATVGYMELLVVLAVVLLLFGSTRLPKLARALGESITQFKGGLAKDDKPVDDKPRPNDGASES